MGYSMSIEAHNQPRVGVPYRTKNEEDTGDLRKFKNYVDAIRKAGGLPEPVSLNLAAAELESQAARLDAFVLPGSPADINPGLYGAKPIAQCKQADPARERTDFALLKYAFEQGKPLLAICYGVQSLNVYSGGTLVQDIPSEVKTEIRHSREGLARGDDDPKHPVGIDAGSRLAQLAGVTSVEVNSSHHQAIREPGRQLRITARAPDGVIEAVEWTSDQNWITGVQWHPERMAGDALAEALFRQLIEAARVAAVRG
jgi:putative glutamine amidotransferase